MTSSFHFPKLLGFCSWKENLAPFWRNRWSILRTVTTVCTLTMRAVLNSFHQLSKCPVLGIRLNSRCRVPSNLCLKVGEYFRTHLSVKRGGGVRYQRKYMSYLWKLAAMAFIYSKAQSVSALQIARQIQNGYEVWLKEYFPTRFDPLKSIDSKTSCYRLFTFTRQTDWTIRHCSVCVVCEGFFFPYQGLDTTQHNRSVHILLITGYVLVADCLLTVVNLQMSLPTSPSACCLLISFSPTHHTQSLLAFAFVN